MFLLSSVIINHCFEISSYWRFKLVTRKWGFIFVLVPFSIGIFKSKKLIFMSYFRQNQLIWNFRALNSSIMLGSTWYLVGHLDKVKHRGLLWFLKKLYFPCIFFLFRMSYPFTYFRHPLTWSYVLCSLPCYLLKMLLVWSSRALIGI